MMMYQSQQGIHEETAQEISKSRERLYRWLTPSESVGKQKELEAPAAWKQEVTNAL